MRPDELEFIASERNAQTEFQITARKDAQLQFKARPSETHPPRPESRYVGAGLLRHALQMDRGLRFSPGIDREERFLGPRSPTCHQGQVEVRRSWSGKRRAGGGRPGTIRFTSALRT